MLDRLEILARLMADHVDARRVLTALEQEVDRVAQFHAPDAAILADALGFFSDPMDRCHHPLEDLICGALKRRDREAARDLDKITGEHAEAAGLLAQLSDAGRDLLAEPGRAPRAAFCRTARGLIAFERHHMRREETFLFVRAADRLTPEDWQAVALTCRGLTPAADGSTPAGTLAWARDMDSAERWTRTAQKRIDGLSADLRRRSGGGP